MTKKQLFIIIVIAFFAVAIIANVVNGEVYVAPVEVEQTLDERDSIQKLTDNLAQSYRELVEAEEAHADTQVKLENATVEYNEAVSYLQTYIQ